MPIFIKTLCFSTAGGKFKSEKDDPKVNDTLSHLQEHGAKIVDIKLSVGGLISGAIVSYLITYESPTPID